MNTSPFEQQVAVGSDGKTYHCTVAGDPIVDTGPDGKARAGEQWIQEGDETGKIFTRS